MNDCYKSPPISAQFSVVRFTVNSVALPFDYAQEPRSVARSRSRRVEGSTVNIMSECNRNWYDCKIYRNTRKLSV